MVSPLRRHICLNPVWLGMGCRPRLRRAHPRTVRARYASPHSPPAKLDSAKFGSSRRPQPAGLVNSCTQGGLEAPPPEPRWGREYLKFMCTSNSQVEIYTTNPFVSIDAIEFSSGPEQSVCGHCDRLMYRVYRKPEFTYGPFYDQRNARSFTDE